MSALPGDPGREMYSDDVAATRRHGFYLLEARGLDVQLVNARDV